MADPTPQDDALQEAIFSFYRNEIAKRFELENIRRFQQFDVVTDDQATALRNYFLERIYPPTENRAELDEALQRLRDILVSPKRVRPFMTAGLKSMWKLGAMLPASVKAGTNVMDTYLVARRVEEGMLAAAQEEGLAPDADSEEMLDCIRALPESDIMKLVADLMHLFRILTNTKMLEVAIEFLNTCETIMRRKPDYYDDRDLLGIKLGTELVSGGLELFRTINPEHFDQIIDGIEAIELDWYRRVTAG